MPGQLSVLAKKYDVDEDVLGRLGNLVNNPSYKPNSVERSVGEDGQERVSMMVYTGTCYYDPCPHAQCTLSGYLVRKNGPEFKIAISFNLL